MPYDFLFTFPALNQQTADLEKKSYSLKLTGLSRQTPRRA